MFCKNDACINNVEVEGEVCPTCQTKLAEQERREEARRKRREQFEQQVVTDSKSAGFTLVPLNQGSIKGQAVPHGKGLGHKTKPDRAKREAKRAARRAERLAAQPKKGKSDGSSKNQYKKGGKKK